MSDTIIDEVHAMMTEAAKLETQAKKLKVRAQATLQAAYGAHFKNLYAAKDEPFGTASIPLLNGDLVCTVSKNVSWDQEKLKELQKTIAGWNENPDDYIEAKLNVSEAKYKAWPAGLKANFDPARTVKAGATSITFKPKE